MEIFIIQSPLQYINAIAAKRYYNLKTDKTILIIVYNNNKENVKQLKFIKKNDFETWKKKIEVYTNGKFNIWLNLKKVIRENLSNEINKVYLGNYKNAIFRDVANRFFDNITVLDDGAASIMVYNQLSKQKGKLNNTDNKIKHLVMKMIGFNSYPEKKVTMFSVYNELKNNEWVEIDYNNYGVFKKEINRNSVQKYVVVLGSPYVEMNIMKHNDYINILRKIIDRLSIPILYIPHRHETLEKVNEVKKIGFKISRINTSIEFELLNSNLSIPKNIIAFATSALINLNLLLEGKDITIQAIKPNLKKFIGAHKEIYKEVYSYYEGHIEVIDENDV